MPHIIIENYTKNSVKEQKYSDMQSLFFVLFKAKDVF
jgi:Na+(H+)/acetate symporter ActP